MKRTTKIASLGLGISIIVGLPCVGSAQLSIDGLGNLHNEVLASYFRAGNQMMTPATYQAQMTGTVSFICNEGMSRGVTSSLCEDQVSGTNLMLQFISERIATNNDAAFFDAKVGAITARLPVGPEEQMIIGQLRDILFGSMPIEVVQTQLTALYEQLGSSQTDAIFREWVGGVLSIGIGSSVFWSNPMNRGGTGDPYRFLLGDCFGYLIGWGGAVLDDIYSPGGLTPAGEERRIAMGAYGAMVGSVFGP